MNVQEPPAGLQGGGGGGYGGGGGGGYGGGGGGYGGGGGGYPAPAPKPKPSYGGSKGGGYKPQQMQTAYSSNQVQVTTMISHDDAGRSSSYFKRA